MTDVVEERCRNGHLRTPENTMWENLGNGKKRRRCRVCRNLRNRKGGESDAIIIGGVELVDNVVYDTSSLSIDDRLAIAEFDKTLKMVDTKCKDKPREFVDWNADAVDVSEVPTPDYAASLCEGCPFSNASNGPLAGMCDAQAEAKRPAWGVFDGKVWIFGNKYDKGEYDRRNSN